MKKYNLIIILAIAIISCNGQENKTEKISNSYIVTYQKDGKTIQDTVLIQDTTLQNNLKRMMTDPNYKPREPQNDTIFNSKRNPILVKLNSNIFGATIQKFEYDSLDNLIRITGYDNKNSIKPFYHDVAIEINKYDQNGNLLEIRNLGENEQLISSEFEDTPITRMKYNDKNQLIEKWFLDENVNLRTEFAILKYDYDKQGNRIKLGWFNKEGEKK